MRFFDAHNHLQDDRFAGRQDELVTVASQAGVVRMVVNGTCEADWPHVAELARRHPQVRPSFGCHPWRLRERTPRWQEELVRHLDALPGAAIGEIGLDRWMLENPERWRAYLGGSAGGPPAVAAMPDSARGILAASDAKVSGAGEPPALQPLSLAGQEEAFVWQLRLAAEREVAASIHCLQAWGRLRELLQANPRPAGGFLLHSYGGPAELVAPLAKLGAYFGFPGHFAHERKARQREVFRVVPPDRLLIETDAPDQLLPDALNPHPLADPATGNALNHPANLPAAYRFLANFLGEPAEALTVRVAENFARLFGG